MDSTINRAHQHGTNLPRGKKAADEGEDLTDSASQTGPSPGDAAAGAIASLVECDTEGFIELQGSCKSQAC